MRTPMKMAIVACYGIAGRDRKAKFHNKELGRYQLSEVDKIQLSREAKTWLSGIKNVSRPSLSLFSCEIENDSGLEIMEVNLFSGKETIPLD